MRRNASQTRISDGALPLAIQPYASPKRSAPAYALTSGAR
jgi:hypothetical protein